DPPRVVVAAAQDPAPFGLRGARPGEPDVGVERDPLSLRVAGVVGVVELALLAQRRPVRLFAADHQLLLAARDAVPALDPVADDANDLVGAAARPGRLLATGPDELRHRRLVFDVRIGGPVLESEQVAPGARFALWGGQEPFNLPARPEDSARRAGYVAE